MIDQSFLDVSAHRLDKAKDLPTQAETLLNTASYDGSINRSYYAIFNAIRALLALIGVDRRSLLLSLCCVLNDLQNRSAKGKAAAEGTQA